MRAGLLTRFWGSLGMALGAVSFIFFQFALLWFVYLGLLLLGGSPAATAPGSQAKPRLAEQRRGDAAADRRPRRDRPRRESAGTRRGASSAALSRAG